MACKRDFENNTLEWRGVRHRCHINFSNAANTKVNTADLYNIGLNFFLFWSHGIFHADIEEDFFHVEIGIFRLIKKIGKLA